MTIPLLLLDLLVLTLLLLGAPLLGVWLAGKDPSPYLVFPWIPERVTVAPFNAPYVALLALVTVAALAPFVVRFLRAAPRLPTPAPAARPFPWWGWASLVCLALSWTAAWTRLPLLAPVQIHTYSPVWYSFIVLLNALAWWRTGRSLLTHRTGFFLALFPLSAAFWWYFEYLNRFTGNWYYHAPGLGRPIAEHLGPLAYAVFGSISFATVLPGVLSVRELLLARPGVFSRFDGWGRYRPGRPTGAGLLALSAASLTALPAFPDLLYPLLWISPGLALTGLRLLTRRTHAFSPAASGNWGGLAAAMLAALLCGCCWELWNWWSEAQWLYQVPYVGDLRLFAMPLPGYAGYLPFGIECLAATVVAEELTRPTVNPIAGGAP